MLKECTNEESNISIKEKNQNNNTNFKKFKQFLIRQYLPISLLFLLFVGIVLPQPGHALDLKVTKYILIVYLFLYCGCYLRVTEIKEALVAYKAVAWGIVSILGITCVVGGKLTELLLTSNDKTYIGDKNTHYGGNETYLGANNTNKISNLSASDPTLDVLGPIELRYGLLIYVIMPCTISTGIVMVIQLNGHFAIAILLTVVTNLTSVFTIPLYIKWMLVRSSTVHFDILAMLFKLSVTVLLPIIVGKGFGFIKPVRKFLDVANHKLVLRLINLTCIAFIVWFKVSTTSYEGKLSQLTAVSVLFVMAWALAMHIIFLIINFVATYILKLDVKQRKCVVILASQKTLTIGVSVLIFLPKSLGDTGFCAIAMVISHISILIFDSFLIQIWLTYERKREKLAGIEMEKDVNETILSK